MKNLKIYLLYIILSLIWMNNITLADEVIKNGAKLKLKPGTHLVEKGSISIQANSNLIIEGMITVEGSLSNNNGYKGIHIESNSEHTGSLIYNEGSPKAEIERYMTTKTSHFIGAPLTGAIAEQLNMGNNISTHLYSYIDGFGLSEITNNNEALNIGQGYRYVIGAASQSGIVPVFEGNLFSADLELDNSTIPPIQLNSQGINMVANPYSSAIDWDDENISYNSLEHSIWVWDSRTRRFFYRNNSGYGNLKDGIIPMGQAFYIKALSNDASLTIPKSARRHDEQDFYKGDKSINDELSYVSFEVRQDSLSDEVWVGYQWDSSDDFDNGIDITKMFSFEDEPQIFASHNDLELSVDIIEQPSTEAKTIPIYLIPGNNGLHQINMIAWQGFSSEDVFLEDLFTQEMMDIKTMDSYEFEANTEDDANRFLLHINGFNTVSVDYTNNNPSQVSIYSYKNNIYLKSDGDYAKQCKLVLIYDINGKMLQRISLEASAMNQIPQNYPSQIIMVKAIYNQDSFTQKIIN